MNFKQSYTFDNFIVTAASEEAYQAARGVASGVIGRPGFLVICSQGPGLGKTHLLRAIERQVGECFSGHSVRYLTADDFTSDMVQALREQKKDWFRRKYSDVDILLVDDIHTLEGRPQVQEELFFTFGELYAGGKQIAMTVDAVGGKLPDYAEKLLKRFTRGMAVKLEEPDFAGRMEILRQIPESSNLDETVLKIMAERGPADIRRLKGIMTRVLACGELLGEEMSADLTERILAEVHCPEEASML